MEFDRSREDLGNIVEFGHVNLRVPDPAAATLFYVWGLGLTRDPYLMVGLDNMWVNVGRAQFHLPTGPAQKLRGMVGLVVPELGALRERLAMLARPLAETRFHVEDGADAITVTCPWGNRIRCHAPDAARFGAFVLGMPYVALDCPLGTAVGIARFYAELLGARACLEQVSGVMVARVHAGPDECLLFRETEGVLAQYDGHHVQITLADFSGPHRRLRERGLVTEESNAHQYRFLDIVDPASGETLLRLEHEVRSMRHPMFGRVLVNRDPARSAARFVLGREALAWAVDRH